jgi:hypothetical protein
LISFNISGIGNAKIVDIVAGEAFGAAIADTGKLFTWGFGNVIYIYRI